MGNFIPKKVRTVKLEFNSVNWPDDFMKGAESEQAEDYRMLQADELLESILVNGTTLKKSASRKSQKKTKAKS